MYYNIEISIINLSRLQCIVSVSVSVSASANRFSTNTGIGNIGKKWYRSISIDNHGCDTVLPATTSHPSGEPLDSFGLGFSNLENDWELARSWECEELGTTTHQIVDVQGRL